MEPEDVIEFFNRLAPTWDAGIIRDEDKIAAILNYGGVRAGKRILDVACGTGVLFPDYLKRDVSCVVGVDISPEMAKIARGKCHDGRITVICADVQELDLAGAFDCIMIYNAFPHFPDGNRLFRKLSGHLAPGGRITVAHGMSRERINAQHSSKARRVSVGLLPADELAALMAHWFTVDVIVSDHEKYIVSGKAG